MDQNEFSSTQQNLSYALAQNGFNMEAIITRSKVISSFKKSNDDIKSAQYAELKKISDIVRNEKENLMNLIQKCEKFNFRCEYKIQMALKIQNSLFKNMEEVTDSLGKLDIAIKELDEFKKSAEQRNKEIDGLWKSLNDIQHLEIRQVNAKIQELHNDINTVQSSIAYGVQEHEHLQSELNNLSLELTTANEKLIQLDKSIDIGHYQLKIETDQHLKYTNSLAELQRDGENKSINLVEKQQNSEKIYNDTMTSLKIELEREFETEKMIKSNTTKMIAHERASDDQRLNKLNEQYDTNAIKISLQIENCKTTQDQLNKNIEFQNSERINEQKIMMEKLKYIELMKKQKMEITVMIQQKELENKQLEEKHKTDELELQNISNNEIRKLEEKIQQHKSKIQALQLEAIASPQSNSTIDHTPRINPNLNNRTIRRDYVSATDEESFLTNFSFDSDLMSNSNRIPFSSNFFDPLALRSSKSAGIPKPVKKN